MPGELRDVGDVDPEKIVLGTAECVGSVVLLNLQHYGVVTRRGGWAARGECVCGWEGKWHADRDDRCLDPAQAELDEHRAAAHARTVDESPAS
jgi:hypothetical protein